MYLDINAKEFPFSHGLQPNTEVIGGNYEVVPGGSALNFARFCAALALAPVFIGKVGDDPIGKLLTELVTESGVTPAFISSPHVETNVGMNFVGQNGSSIMTVVGSANQSLQGEEVLAKIEEHLTGVQYLYFGGCFKLTMFRQWYKTIAAKAHEMQVKVVLDHGRITNSVSEEDKETMKNLLPHVDYYLPSRDEFLTLWQVATIEEGITKVREYSAATIVVKDAENGAYGSKDDEIVHVPSFPVNVINTIGAGDSFNAGFITSQTLGLSLEEGMKFACATAAVKISHDTVPTTKEVRKLLHAE